MAPNLEVLGGYSRLPAWGSLPVLLTEQGIKEWGMGSGVGNGGWGVGWRMGDGARTGALSTDVAPPTSLLPTALLWRLTGDTDTQREARALLSPAQTLADTQALSLLHLTPHGPVAL